MHVGVPPVCGCDPVTCLCGVVGGEGLVRGSINDSFLSNKRKRGADYAVMVGFGDGASERVQAELSTFIHTHTPHNIHTCHRSIAPDPTTDAAC